MDLLQPFALRGFRLRAGRGGRADHRRHRRPDLVAHVGEEGTLGAVAPSASSLAWASSAVRCSDHLGQVVAVLLEFGKVAVALGDVGDVGDQMFDAPKLTIAEAMLTSRSSPLRCRQRAGRSAALCRRRVAPSASAGGLPAKAMACPSDVLGEQFLALPANRLPLITRVDDVDEAAIGNIGDRDRQRTGAGRRCRNAPAVRDDAFGLEQRTIAMRLSRTNAKAPRRRKPVPRIRPIVSNAIRREINWLLAVASRWSVWRRGTNPFRDRFECRNDGFPGDQSR